MKTWQVKRAKTERDGTREERDGKEVKCGDTRRDGREAERGQGTGRGKMRGRRRLGHDESEEKYTP